MDRNRYRAQGPETASKDDWVYDGDFTAVHDITMFHETESMADTVTPGFRQKMQSGEIINNPMSYVKDTINSTGGGTYSAVYTPWGIERYKRSGPGCLTTLQVQLVQGRYSYLLPTLLQQVEVPDSYYDEAKSKALGFVDRTPYSFAEDVGEIYETIRFLKDPTQSLRDLSLSFSQLWKKKKSLLKLKDAYTLSKAFADVWLQYRFALTPLLRSMEDALRASLDKVPQATRKVARGKVEFNHFDNDYSQAPTSGSHQFTWDQHLSQTAEVKAGILYEVTNPLQSWRALYGLRFKDIPETMWALLPYSFMVDRLINISQTIRGIESFLDPNVKYLAGWTTTKHWRDQSLSFIGQTVPNYAVTVQPDIERKKHFSYNREVWEPSIQDTVGRFDLKGLVDDATKVTDLLALILGRLRM